MQELPITVKTPGKLMVAGEFAVLEPYQQLVVMAVDRFVYADIQKSQQRKLSLTDFGLVDLAWTYQNGELMIDTNDERIQFVKDALTTVFKYLEEKHIAIGTFHLAVKSELDDASGAKYGLGSSAAVVSSVVAAVLHAHLPQPPSQALLFKLAAISHVKTQGSGSGADVAASTHGGFLAYRSFQADWLLDQYSESATVTELVEADWPYFSLHPITLPENVHLCIGWTGSPASTAKLIPVIRGLNHYDATFYDRFLADSRQAVTTFLAGVQKHDHTQLFQSVKANRHALATVGERAGVEVETPLLKTLSDLAENHGGVGKPSGAGGGDCGIAFMPDEASVDRLKEAWQKAGIRPLALKPYSYGSQRI